MQPDTFTSATNTITDESVDGGTDGNGDLDWADEELSMSFHDGFDGTMTPYTERPYTDGSMTPLTEASWMDESMTPSSCPGTPDVALDLPLLQTPNIDRVSASGHVRIDTTWMCSAHSVFCFWLLTQTDASVRAGLLACHDLNSNSKIVFNELLLRTKIKDWIPQRYKKQL